ncbi:hypothetical protein HK102_002961 [Quaeritorhiza haematococci]|nr:hypothetical protein HK102_002961 [Quaeritorhiza haematococci]
MHPTPAPALGGQSEPPNVTYNYHYAPEAPPLAAAAPSSTPANQPIQYYLSRARLQANIRGFGIDEHAESSVRFKSCRLMRRLCRQLGFPFNTAATAQHLYHKFFATHSIENYDVNKMAIACVFVASKIEETIKKVRDIIAVAWTIMNGAEYDPEAHDAENEKKEIIGFERSLLEDTGFDFQLLHPHKFVVKFAQKQGASKKLAAKAWSIVEDRTTLCIQYPPHAIALGALHLASKLKPEDTPNFLAFDDDFLEQHYCKMDYIKDIYEQLLDLYLQILPEERDAGPYQKLKLEIDEQNRSLNRRNGVTRTPTSYGYSAATISIASALATPADHPI